MSLATHLCAGACPKCHKVYTWTGLLRDRPRCPDCGHKPTPSRLGDAMDAAIAARYDAKATKPLFEGAT